MGPPTEKEEGRLPVGRSAALIAGLSVLSWAALIPIVVTLRWFYSRLLRGRCGGEV